MKYAIFVALIVVACIYFATAHEDEHGINNHIEQDLVNDVAVHYPLTALVYRLRL